MSGTGTGTGSAGGNTGGNQGGNASGNAGGNAAPAPGAAPAAPAPPPLGQSPKLRGGISERDAIGAHLQLRRSRKGGAAAAAAANGAAAPPAAPPAPARHAPAMQTPSDTRPPATATPATPPSNGANGHAATEPGGELDPIDKLIATMRQPRQEGSADPAAPPPPTPGAEPAPLTGPVRLTIDGRTADFTPEQLANHVRMSADYTRKAQQLAGLAKEVNERQQAIEQMMPVLVPEIQRQIALLDGQLKSEPDWAKLAATDPAEYQRQDAAWKAAIAERTRLAQLQGMQEQESKEQQQKRILESHRVLVKELPGWENPATRVHYQNSMRQWAMNNGFSAAEMDNVTEARHVVALWKAMAFDRWKTIQNVTPPAPNVSGNGAAPGMPQTGRQMEAASSFIERPNVRNAAALYAQMRGARKRGN